MLFVGISFTLLNLGREKKILVSFEFPHEFNFLDDNISDLFLDVGWEFVNVLPLGSLSGKDVVSESFVLARKDDRIPLALAQHLVLLFIEEIVEIDKVCNLRIVKVAHAIFFQEIDDLNNLNSIAVVSVHSREDVSWHEVAASA